MREVRSGGATDRHVNRQPRLARRHARACADTELDERQSKVTEGRSLRNLHNRADAAPECDPRYPGRSATSVTVSEPVNTRRPVSALASMTGRKAVERKRLGNHYKAYEFEYQAVTDASGQDGRGRTLVT